MIKLETKEVKLYLTSDYKPSIEELDSLGKDLHKLMLKYPFIGGYNTAVI